MALRVLSGLLTFDGFDIPLGGSAVISFNPFGLSSAPTGVNLADQRSIGPERDFTSTPCRIVGLREWKTMSEGVLDFTHPNININDFIDNSSLTISWNAGIGDMLPNEVPFMVVGDVGFSLFDLFLRPRR